MTQALTHPATTEPFDPTEYKPPRLRLNVNGKKAQYLRCIGDGLSLRQATVVTGVHAKQHYRHIKNDPDYAADYASVKCLRDGYLEDSMYARACKSDTLAGIFLLKASDPARFSDRHVNVNVTDVAININDARAQLAAMVESNPALGPALLQAMGQDQRAIGSSVVAESDATSTEGVPPPSLDRDGV